MLWGGGGGGATGLLNKGGGATGFLWNFHRYRLVYIIILDPDERTMTVCSNDTLVDTPFQLISGFFHVNQGVLCC